MTQFAQRLIDWQLLHGRHGLPWQGGSAYQVWLSEIMLQQTQVVTVIPYYLRFIEAFPDVVSLAAASQEQVLSLWSGLGYYARGRNLHRAAQLIVSQHQGQFPRDFDAIQALPGIGRSTAAAICAQAYHQPYPILDGNVKRLLARYCGVVGEVSSKAVQDLLWQYAERLLPTYQIAAYTQAQMDMGALICTRSKPQCQRCPVQADCVAYQQQRVAELPTPRQRKIQPLKQAWFLLIFYQDRLLLEKRPPAGIWGGLWCVPQLDYEPNQPQASLQQYLQQQQLLFSRLTNLEPFEHVFSHFKLKIHPVFIQLEQLPTQVNQAEQCWLPVDQVLQQGIPTPLRKLLQVAI